MKKLNIIDKAFLLKKSSLFSALDLDLLLTIADKMELHSFKENECIFTSGQEGKNMFLIVQGSVNIFQDSKELSLLNGGEFFGDEAVFNEKNREYTAKCKTSVIALSLTRNHILGIIGECPSVAVALLECYTRKVSYRER